MRYMKRLLEKVGVASNTLTELDWARDSKFLLLESTAGEALSVWEALRENHEKSGYWPIIIGDASEELEWLTPPDETRISVAAPNTEGLMQLTNQIQELSEMLSNVRSTTTNQITAISNQTGPWKETMTAMIESTAAADVESLTTIYSETMAPAEAIAKSELFDFIGWVEHRCKQSSPTIIETEPSFEHEPTECIGALEAEPETPCSLLLVKSVESWHVPAHLAFGAWNDCPPSYVHVAALKGWNKQYAAEIVSITRDSFYTRVQNPVTTMKKAVSVAEQHYAYCPDLVHQSDGSLKGLAQEILNAELWSFWWS